MHLPVMSFDAIIALTSATECPGMAIRDDLIAPLCKKKAGLSWAKNGLFQEISSSG